MDAREPGRIYRWTPQLRSGTIEPDHESELLRFRLGDACGTLHDDLEDGRPKTTAVTFVKVDDRARDVRYAGESVASDTCDTNEPAPGE